MSRKKVVKKKSTFEYVMEERADLLSFILDHTRTLSGIFPFLSKACKVEIGSENDLHIANISLLQGIAGILKTLPKTFD